MRTYLGTFLRTYLGTFLGMLAVILGKMRVKSTVTSGPAADAISAMRRHVCADALRGSALLAGSAFVAACAGLPPAGLVAPRLSVRSMSVTHVRADEIRLRVDVDAHNPNPREIPLADLKLELELLGRPAATARAVEPVVTLPASATRTVTLDVSVPARSAGELLLRAARSGELRALPYRLSGSAAWGADGVSLPFQRSGTIDLMQRLRREDRSQPDERLRRDERLRPDAPLPSGDRHELLDPPRSTR